jgi:Flp pilus assembly protein TadD
MIRATAKEPDLRDLAGAVQLAERACELSEYQDAESLAILATAYAHAGRPAEAKVATGRAIDRARKSGNAALAGAIQKTLETSRQPPRP